MALKATVDSLDDIPEALRSEYKETQVGDKKIFVLQVEGVQQHPDVTALSNALARLKTDKTTLSAEITALKAQVAKVPEDFTPEEWERLKALPPEDPAKQSEHLQSLKTQYEQRLATAKRAAEEAEAKLTKQIQDMETELNRIVLDDGLTRALVENGVGKEYMKAATALLRSSAKVKVADGKREGIFETDLGEQSIAEFVKGWVQSDEGKVFVPKATGSDANGSNNTRTEMNPWVNKTYNLTEQGRILNADPAKADRMKRAAEVENKRQPQAA